MRSLTLSLCFMLAVGLSTPVLLSSTPTLSPEAQLSSGGENDPPLQPDPKQTKQKKAKTKGKPSKAKEHSGQE